MALFNNGAIRASIRMQKAQIEIGRGPGEETTDRGVRILFSAMLPGWADAPQVRTLAANG
jgi:hypothetical protein